MKKFWKLTAGVMLASCLLLSPATAEPSKDDVVARVFDVSGKGFQVQRDGGKWEKSKKDSAGFVKDHYKTDNATTAALELLIGARVGIKKGSEIVLLSDSDAGVVDGKTVRKIVLNNGGLYAKFHTQPKPLTIQTKGGVMGIKGTEFSVDTEESGDTSVTLLEGSVDYKEDKSGGKTYEMVRGQKLRQFDKDGELYTVKGEPSEVDKAVADFLSGLNPIGNIDSVQDVLNTNWRGLGPDAVNNLVSKSRQNILAPLGPVGSLINSWAPSIPNLGSWNVNIPGAGIINKIPSGFPRF